MKWLLLFTLCLSMQVNAWTNHTLIAQGLLATIPQVRDAQAVRAETLDAFLIKNEDALVGFLQEQELWMRKNLWHYAPLPDDLVFIATGGVNDIRQRFAQAIRINPHAPFPLYLQLLPGESRPLLNKIQPGDIRTYKDIEYLGDVEIVALQAGQWVAPLDILSSANDEPDHGLDIGLFTDSGTEYGKKYGFGKQPFGNPNVDYSTQAPFHMGFYHEAEILYVVNGALRETYPEFRIFLIKALSEFAFAHGSDYWGWRFMGWGMHYIGDFSNPYHVTVMPGKSALKTVSTGILSALNIGHAQANTTQLLANRHTLIEDFQSIIMSDAYVEGQPANKTIEALRMPVQVKEFENRDVVNVFAQISHSKSAQVHRVLLSSMPDEFVNDELREYVFSPERRKLIENIRNSNGQKAVDNMTKTIADLLEDFAAHSASYILSITQ